MGKTAPGRLAAVKGCTSDGGLLNGSGSAGGGKTAPVRIAALFGWIAAAAGFFGAAGFDAARDVYLGTGAKVVSGCGVAPLAEGGFALIFCAAVYSWNRSRYRPPQNQSDCHRSASHQGEGSR